MATELSFTKRAAAELSRCFNGLNVSKAASSATTSSDSMGASTSSSADADGSRSRKPYNGSEQSEPKSKSSGGFFTLANSVRNIGSAYERNIQAAKNAAATSFRLGSSNSSTSSSSAATAVGSNSNATAVAGPGTPRKQPPKAPPKTARARRRNFLLGLAMQLPKERADIWSDRKLMSMILVHCEATDKLRLVQVSLKTHGLLNIYACEREARFHLLVCKLWRDILYEDNSLWTNFYVKIDFAYLRRRSTDRQRAELLRSLPTRSFDAIVIYAAQDEELQELASAVGTFGSLRSLALRCCGFGDAALQQLLANFGGRLTRLELLSCNDLSDSAHWSALCPQLRHLMIADCINVADETIASIGQTLPRLVELSVQAYHVTDACFAYLRQPVTGGDQFGALRILRLNNCWELSNQAVLQVAHCLPQVRQLSLSGCSKITDEAVELIAEQMRCLKHLNLSWCARISDAALECIACDLSESLTELVLDRCVNVTDIGIGYVATMARLESLSIRWCSQVRDYGLQTICAMPSLQYLSLAGCSLITPNGLGCLKKLQSLRELELTNCPAASLEMVAYLQKQLPTNCVIHK